MHVNVAHDRINNFDAIRLLGAVLVLVGHAFPLHGVPGNPVVWGGLIQVAGLVFFFSISGYLIARSWHLDPQLLRYLQKRALRIFPALAVVTLLSMFVLGPLLSRVSLHEYLTNPHLWHYLKNVILSPVYPLPGVFESTPIPNTVNASLWSLPAEFACYLVVPLVALLPTKARSATYLAVGIAAGMAARIMREDGFRLVFYGTDVAQAVSIWPFFMVGAAIALAPTRLPLRLDFGLIALMAGSLLASILPAQASYVWWIVLPYSVIALGCARTPGICRAGRFGDLSYGLYLYAFPIQQMLIVVFPHMRFATSVLAALALSLTLAFASWHLVEKRVLKFKPSHPVRRAPASETVVAAEGEPGLIGDGIH